MDHNIYNLEYDVDAVLPGLLSSLKSSVNIGAGLNDAATTHARRGWKECLFKKS